MPKIGLGLLGTMRRRAFPIRAYVGANGSGKSLAAVHDLVPVLDAGQMPVLSTVRLLDFRNPRPCDDPYCQGEGHPDHAAAHPSWRALVDARQMVDAHDCVIFLDEVTGVASSREGSKLPVQLANLLVQCRRRNIELVWTAPNWARADRIVREVTQCVTACRGFWPRTRMADGKAWSENRLFMWKSYDARDMDQWSEEKRKKIRAHHVQWHRRSRHLAQSAYDTFAGVASFGWASDAGMCMSCAGRRTVPICKCGTERALARPAGLLQVQHQH